MLDLVGFDLGVHLRGTPLWFDAERRRGHAVLTNLGMRMPPAHQRVLAPHALAGVLKQVGYRRSVLPAPWDRWIGFGGQKIKFIDLGGPFGAAAALVSGGEGVVVTGLLPRNQKVRWQSAGHVVMALPALSHRGAEPEEVVLSLERFAVEAGGAQRGRVVLVDTLDMGHFFVTALRGLGLAVRSVGLLAKVMGEDGRAGRGLAVGLLGSRVKAREIAWVDSGVRGSEPGEPGEGAPRRSFPVNWFGRGEDALEVVEAVGARRVSLIGGDRLAGEELGRILGPGVQVRRFAPERQLQLGG